MKLVRFGPRGHEKPGVWLDNTPEPGIASILDVSATAYDMADYNEHFFAHDGIARVANLLHEQHRKLVPATDVRLGPPVARPSKIICLGTNYAAHAKEFKHDLPTCPIIFAKATTALNGPTDPIILAAESKTVDCEVELALVMGRRASQVREEEALDYVAGYTIMNDVTDRDAQKQGLQWFRGKGFDTFAPLGPYLVTHDEIADPHNLRLVAKHNGVVLQDDCSAEMLFKIPMLLAFISRAMTLLPGDIISTGTPSGIGSARQPPRLLQPGDQVELSIEGLGVQHCTVTRQSET